jgi:serine/threonine protein kinase
MYEVVGIGGFGKVHKAYNKRSGMTCALKVLKKESVAAMKHVDHIINEREVLQYLSDRNRQFFEELAHQ